MYEANPAQNVFASWLNNPVLNESCVDPDPEASWHLHCYASNVASHNCCCGHEKAP